MPIVPALPGLTALRAEAEAAVEDQDSEAFEELSLRLARAAIHASRQTPPRAPAARDYRRVAEAVRLIELEGDRPLPLTEIAGAAATSSYHFLRIFRQVTGTTPHQFVLRTRLHRAAVRLRRSTETIASIAYDAGFGDLSTFNRRFRREMGFSPSAFRQRTLRR